MKRSYINKIIQEADDVFTENNFLLPKWAHWGKKQWTETINDSPLGANSIAGIVHPQLGWDITDFGRGSFESFGLVLFTIRNGIPSEGARHFDDGTQANTKTYCEKLMICQPGQRNPMHFHWHKCEDIICRGGAPLILEVFASDKKTEELDKESDVVVSIDGIRTVFRPRLGEKVRLLPGESITLPPGIYHRFWAMEECDMLPSDVEQMPEKIKKSLGKPCLIGEVSLVNDDDNDNKFTEPLGRFPTIVEDEEPLYLLTKDYEKHLAIPSSAAVTAD